MKALNSFLIAINAFLLTTGSLALLGGAEMSTAQTLADSSVPQTSLNTSTDLTARDLETLLDELVPNQLESHHIPGAAVVVVKDGKLLFAKGYGYADLENLAGFLIALYFFVIRPWQTTWGATKEEVQQVLLGGDVVAKPHFVATRAIAIHAPPSEVWQ